MMTSTNSTQLIWFSKQRRMEVTRSHRPISRSFPALTFDTPWKGIGGAVKHDKVIMATQAVKPNDVSRPLANFHPNIWGDSFLLSDLERDKLMKGEKELLLTVGALTKELKTRLMEINKCPMELLKLIDTIQRLGLDYHFETEIDGALQDIYRNYHDIQNSNNDLYSNALSFRLLRQHGYKVSCGCFEKFKNVKGEFKDSITSDVMGMLEFHEATYLSIQGEDVLDQGRTFTVAHLYSILPNLSNSAIGKQVSYALQHSIRRGLPRLLTRNYISICDEHALCHENLLKLAKLDFNLVQSIHKRELSELYSWWKGLDVPKNFFYARDRCVEMYLFALGVYFEPQYDVARKYSSRMWLLVSILDDTYDAYGTFEELQTLTDTIESWSSPSNSLPGSMKVLYKALWEVVNEIEDELVDGENNANYAKEVIKLIARAYFKEVTWREEKYKSKTTEEYLSVTRKSADAGCAIIITYIGMGDIVPKDVFRWLLTSPIELKVGEIFGRLRDDLAGHEFEKEREHIPSVIDCYMKEHGVCQQEAIDELSNYIDTAWKDLNGKLLMLAKFPTPLLLRALNLFRAAEVVYKNGDFYTHVGEEMQGYIKQILVNPVPL